MGSGASRTKMKSSKRGRPKRPRLISLIPTVALSHLTCLPLEKWGIARANVIFKVPKVVIRVGDYVKPAIQGVKSDGSRSIQLLFLFGGPGTCKGRIVDNMVNMFDMILISGE